jgi:ribosomal protein S18 acetylase RimI-like enzyme
MDICLCNHTVQKLVSSLVPKVLECYPAGDSHALPTLVAIGSSGELVLKDLVEAIPNEIRSGLKTQTVQVSESDSRITNLPDRVAGQEFLVCDGIVNTGKTMAKTRAALLGQGASSVRTLALVVRNGASLIPNFYSISIDKHDEVFFGDELYPIRSYKNGCIRLASDRDAEVTINHGVDFLARRIGDYIHAPDHKPSDGWRTYLIESLQGKIVGVLHFNHKPNGNVFVDTVAVKVDEQRRGYCAALLSFLEDYCRFNGVHRARLQSVENAVSIYEKYGFVRTGKAPSVRAEGVFVEMEVRYVHNE